MDGGAWWATVHGRKESDTTERLQHKILIQEAIFQPQISFGYTAPTSIALV